MVFGLVVGPVFRRGSVPRTEFLWFRCSGRRAWGRGHWWGRWRRLKLENIVVLNRGLNHAREVDRYVAVFLFVLVWNG